MRLALIAALAAMPVAAAADCPDAGDMQKGVLFPLADGAFETFRAVGDGVVEMQFGYDGEVYNVEYLAQGVFLVESVDAENGAILEDTRMTTRFPIPPKEMPAPVPETEVTYTAVTETGNGVDTEERTFTFGPVETIEMSGCTYDLIRIDVATAGGGQFSGEVQHYLPELGFSYLYEYTADGVVDRYVHDRIEVLK